MTRSIIEASNFLIKLCLIIQCHMIYLWIHVLCPHLPAQIRTHTQPRNKHKSHHWSKSPTVLELFFLFSVYSLSSIYKRCNRSRFFILFVIVCRMDFCANNLSIEPDWKTHNAEIKVNGVSRGTATKCGKRRRRRRKNRGKQSINDRSVCHSEYFTWFWCVLLWHTFRVPKHALNSQIKCDICPRNIH